MQRMQDIDTPNRVVGLFGPFDGFGDLQPPNGTNLNAAWCNSVQMEIISVIDGQGIALDGMQVDQLKKAIDDYTFGSPTIGGVLSIGDGINPALITVLPFAVSEIQSGGEFAQRTGSTWTVETGVTLAATGDNTWVWGTGIANNWTINGNVTLGTGTGASTVTIGADAADALTVNATSTFNQPVTIDGFAASGSLTGAQATLCTWQGEMNITGISSRFRMNAQISGAAGDMSRSGARLQFHDGTSTRIVQLSDFGGFKVQGISLAPGAAASVTVTTSTSGAPQSTADVDVVGSAMVQRVAGPGDIILSLTTVGVGQIGTNFTINCPYSAGTQFFQVVFPRTRAAADTTPRQYSFTIDGNGSNVIVRNALVIAECAVK